MRHLSPLVLLLFLGSLCAAANPLPNPGFEELDEAGWAKGWSRYNWGAEGSEGSQKVDATAAHAGKNSLEGVNGSATASGGAYTHVALAKGTWALSFWARAAAGEVALVRCYLGTSYSRAYEVSDQWTRLTFRNALLSPIERAEINVQNATRRACSVWFDEVSLEPSTAPVYRIVSDRRPPAQQPKLIYFDGQLLYWAEHAAKWKARGFRGTFCGYIYSDIHDDPWAADGDPKTRGEDDALVWECRVSNDKCRAAGLDSNVLKVAFYRDLPDPYDEDGYRAITNNFRQAARFARLAGFAGLAIDTEYTAYQFDPTWKGYDLSKHSAEELAAKLQARWADIAEVVVRAYPGVEFMTLPEGAVYYGPLWNSIFAGMIEGLQRRNHPGGIHVFCEGSYQVRDPVRLCDMAEDVRVTIARSLPEAQRRYWLERGTVALGAWPLGYYRAISDKDGKFLGWSGRREVFGDELVGSYADKSPNYPLAEFRPQLAAIRAFSQKYCWIYGHGSSWWQATPEQVDYYAKGSRQNFPDKNYPVPTTPDIAEYYKVAATRETVVGLSPGE